MHKPDSTMIVHMASIAGLSFVAYKFWPKGITYGEREDWEKAYRKRHALKSHRQKEREEVQRAEEEYWAANARWEEEQRQRRRRVAYRDEGYGSARQLEYQEREYNDRRLAYHEEDYDEPRGGRYEVERYAERREEKGSGGPRQKPNYGAGEG